MSSDDEMEIEEVTFHKDDDLELFVAKLEMLLIMRGGDDPQYHMAYDLLIETYRLHVRSKLVTPEGPQPEQRKALEMFAKIIKSIYDKAKNDEKAKWVVEIFETPFTKSALEAPK